MKQRYDLLGMAMADGLLLLGSYNVQFWSRLQHWPGLNRSISLLIAFWLFVSYLLGRYSQARRQERWHQLLFKAIAVAALVLALVVVGLVWALAVDDQRTYRGFVVPILLVTLLGSVLVQMVVRGGRAPLAEWLFVGTDQELMVLNNELHADPVQARLSVRTVPLEDLDPSTLEALPPGCGIAISDTAACSPAVIEELLRLRSRGQQVLSLLSWCEQHLYRVPPELFGRQWLVHADGFVLQPGHLVWQIKRSADLAAAFCLLIFAMPLLLVAAFLIWLEDRGPILYSQLRTGLFGQCFRIWKLRTMVVDAEQAGPAWARSDDQRITLVGRWLRKLRIDELPQLLGVLHGDLSLIGPRPERPELETLLEQEIEHYRIRHWIRPGLSGWAQVCYPYGASVADSRNKLSYDLYYLRHASIGLDLFIALKTLRLVLTAQGSQPQSPR
jgi:exopolysaccharide biosynthesis polyprenyl glycosylphosphotransferase